MGAKGRSEAGREGGKLCTARGVVSGARRLSRLARKRREQGRGAERLSDAIVPPPDGLGS